jgi:hypothetical protein
MIINLDYIASKVHEYWIGTRKEKGFSSVKSEDGEELMVDYNDLSDKQKDKDRKIVLVVLDAADVYSKDDKLWPIG